MWPGHYGWLDDGLMADMLNADWGEANMVLQKKTLCDVINKIKGGKNIGLNAM